MSEFSSSQGKSSQLIHNESYDSTHGMLNVMAVGNNGGSPVRLKVDSDGVLSVTGGGGGTQYNIDTALGATDTTTLAGVVRDDSLTTLTEADGDVTVLRVSSTGALHVTGGGGGTEYNEDVATPATITGTATLMERDDALSTVTPAEGDWIGLRGTAEGALWVQDFNSDTIAGAVSGTEMQVDVVAALPAGTNIVGKVGHDQTTIGHGVKTVTTAGTDEALAGSTTCKKVTIQAQTDNTGFIAVGASGVDATVATGTGVLLAAGDSFELDTTDLATVYIDSTVNGEGVRYTYFN